MLERASFVRGAMDIQLKKIYCLRSDRATSCAVKYCDVHAKGPY